MIHQNLRKVVETNLNHSNFHHVLTEMALLEILRSPHSQPRKSTSVIPVALNGDLRAVFPPDLFPATIAIINLTDGSGKGAQHQKFFMLLRRLFERQESLLHALEATYHECVKTTCQDITAVKIEALEKFYQAHAASRRDDSESWSFAKFLQRLQCPADEIAQVLRIVQNLQEVAVSEEENGCYQALLHPGIAYGDQKDQNPERVEGTCQWALDHTNYIQWRDTDEKRLLWISADAGCGKSVLSRAIVDEDLPRNATGTCVLYFFFKDTSEDQRSANRALCASIHQLLSQRPTLVKHALPRFRRLGKTIGGSSFSDLWSLFMAMVRDSDAGDVICLFDALDECEENGCKQLLASIQAFCASEEQKPSCQLRFLITSRPYLDLKVAFANVIATAVGIRLDGTLESNQIKQEIDLVIKHRVRELGKSIGLQSKVQDYLLKTLLEMENRTYMWLRLVFDSLPRTWPKTVKHMKRIISELPAGISAAYESLLAKCGDAVYARKVLNAVLTAYQPLTLRELDVSIWVSDKTRSYSDLELEDPSSLLETLPGRCGLMITVVDSRAYFIHQTVKEFLLRRRDLDCPDAANHFVRRTGEQEDWVWGGSFAIDEAHHHMALACMRVLLFSDVLNVVDAYQSLFTNVQAPPRKKGRECYEFVTYAEAYWTQHYRDGQISHDLARSLIRENRFVNRDRYPKRFGASAIQLAAFGGHKQIFNVLLEMSPT